MLSLTVKEIMSSPAVTATPETPLEEAVHEMLKGSYSGLPVVNERQEVVGVVTEFDALKAMEGDDRPKCGEVMTSEPFTIDSGATALDALKSLISHNIIRLPVIEDGKLVGIVSRKDILQALSGEPADGDLLFISETTKALLSAKRFGDVLKILVRKMGEYFGAVRCSVIRVEPGESSATVLSTFEDPTIDNLEIDLSKYPEITKACATGEPVIMHDALSDPLLKPVRERLAHIDLKSILVFPIISNDTVVGTLHLRTHTKRQFSPKDTKIAKILSAIAADAMKTVMREEKLRSLYRDTERKVVIDDLTGLFNRRFLNIRLEEEFNMASRHGLPLSCIMFDIDHFKDVNDAFGHEEGDRILVRYASRLRQAVRVSDVAARYGGEEFVLLLPVTDLTGAVEEAERLKAALDSVDFGTVITPLTVSVGVAGFPEQGIRRPEDLIRRADIAMYEAKKAGRNRIAVFRSEGCQISTK